MSIASMMPDLPSASLFDIWASGEGKEPIDNTNQEYAITLIIM